MDIKDDSMTTQNQRLLGFSALLCTIFMLLINLNVVLTITTEWESSGPYSHGYLGFILVGYAFWLKRTTISLLLFKPSLFSSFGLLLSCCLLLFSNLASIQQLQQVSLFLVVLFIIGSLCGANVIKALTLPLLMLALILPIWNIFQLPLRDISTSVSWWGASLFGSEVLRSGYQLITPGGIFAVEPACSGLGFFLVAALLAVWVSFYNRLTWIASAQFLLIALLLAIVANWIRIITIVVVGDRTQMQHVIVQDHLSFGWYIFSACLVPLIFIARRFYPGSTTTQNNDCVATNDSVSARNRAFAEGGTSGQRLAVSGVILALTLFTLANNILPARYQADYKLEPPVLANYDRIISDKPMSPNWQPLFNGVSSESFNYFMQGETGFQLYLANYVRQSQGLEMIYVDNRLFSPSRWRLDSQSQLVIDDSAGLTEVQLLTLARSKARHRLIAFWYVVNGQVTADKYIAKLLEANAAVQGRPGATLMAIALDHNSAEHDEALAELTRFTQAVLAKTVITKTIAID